MTRLTIAMVGQKGLPATWGGVEHHVEEIGARLAARGHEVVVYCRDGYSGPVGPDEYLGMRLVHTPAVGTKHLDAITHAATSTVDALRRRVDVVHFHAVGPGLVAPLAQLRRGTGVVLTVHGLDAERAKWGGFAQRVLRTAEWTSARVPHETVVVSEALQEHFDRVHHRRTELVVNGVDRPLVPAQRSSSREPYVLFVGRLVPEKAPHLLVEAAASLPEGVRVVLAGGSSFTDGYAELLADAARRAGPRVTLPGYVHGEDLQALYAGASAFVLPSAVEGLPLTLLEAASHGVPLIASDIPPHVEVLGADGPGRRLVTQGSVEALAHGVVSVLQGGPAEARGAGVFREDVLSRYRWDDAVDRLEDIYLRAAWRSRAR